METQTNASDDPSENEFCDVINQSSDLSDDITMEIKDDDNEENEMFYDAGEEIDDISDSEKQNSDTEIQISEVDISATQEKDRSLSNVQNLNTNIKTGSNCQFSHFEDMNELSTEAESNDEDSNPEKQKQPVFSKKIVSVDNESSVVFNRTISDADSSDDVEVICAEEKDKTSSAVLRITENLNSVNDAIISYRNEGKNGEDKDTNTDNLLRNLYDEVSIEKNNIIDASEEHYQLVIQEDLSANTAVSDKVTNEGVDTNKNMGKNDGNLFEGDTGKGDSMVQRINDDDGENSCTSMTIKKSISEKEVTQEGESISDSSHAVNTVNNETPLGEINIEYRETDLQRNELKKNSTTDSELLENVIVEHMSTTLKNKSVLKEVNFDQTRIDKEDSEDTDEISPLNCYCKVILHKLNFDEYVLRKHSTDQGESVVLNRKSACSESQNKRTICDVLDSDEETLATFLKKSKIIDSDVTESEDEPLIKFSDRPKKTQHTNMYRESRLKRVNYFDSSFDSENENTSDSEKVKKNVRKLAQRRRSESSTESLRRLEPSNLKPSLSRPQTGLKLNKESPRRSSRYTIKPGENCSEKNSVPKKKSLIISIPRIDEILSSPPNKLFASLEIPVKRNRRFENDKENLTEKNSDSDIEKDDVKNRTVSRFKRSRVSEADSKIKHLKKLIEICGLYVENYDRFWEGCRTYKEKSECVFNFLKENGLKDAPTEENCKNFALQRETEENTRHSAKRMTRSRAKSFVGKKSSKLRRR